MRVQDLGSMRYRQAWAVQEAVHAEVMEGAEERLLLVEHPPVITFGRRPDVNRNLIASDEQLAAMGVEVVQSDRGGDITFHGPGQLVVYPIVRLNDHRLSVGGYVRKLELTIIEALAAMGVAAAKDACAIGVWAGGKKICALGVRIRRGVSLHGIALNVTTDLRGFDLIVPCGLPGRGVTSMQQLLGDRTPPMSEVRRIVSEMFVNSFLPATPVADHNAAAG
jgi:lipoyl(octanoyl) transferase